MGDQLNEGELIRRLKAMVSAQLEIHPDAVSADTELKTLDMDSLDVEELMMLAEQDGLAPDMSEVPRNEFTTIRKIVQKMREMQNEPSAG